METTATSFLCAIAAVLILVIIFLASSIRIVQEDKRLSVYRLGRYIGDKGPGLVLLIPIVDRVVSKPAGASGNVGSQGGESSVVGETRTTVFTEGKVYFNGKEWDAVSQSPIPAGQKVRVVRTILEVEME